MVHAIRVVVFVAGLSATIGLAAEPKEAPKAKIAIHWVELFPIEGLTVDRSAHNGSDTRNDYYPYVKPAMILSREDVADVRVKQLDWETSSGVVHHYAVSLDLTKEARERLAKSCPAKKARITIAVDGRYWGWDHYTTDDKAADSERWSAKNYTPSMGLMRKVDAEHIVNAFK